MAAEDELARRRYERLVGRVEALMRVALKPEYEGYGGQVVLSVKAVEELGGDPAEIRRAARAVGRRLGWKTVTREIDGRIFVLDDREPPPAVRELMARRGTDALDAFLGRD
ncbi:hypothetical protein ACFO3J_28190 [Streptomyces polygonati]|uniref:Uncharacterized protein n=1 Tax=Streptomyces polygonati TaxID=1617087 RepID=A0ABV8HWT1_9ACTN